MFYKPKKFLGEPLHWKRTNVFKNQNSENIASKRLWPPCNFSKEHTFGIRSGTKKCDHKEYQWNQCYFVLHFLCCWHIMRKVIWYVTKSRIFEILCNSYFFSSICQCHVLAVSVLYFEKKLGIGCMNIRKFVILSHIK